MAYGLYTMKRSRQRKRLNKGMAADIDAYQPTIPKSVEEMEEEPTNMQKALWKAQLEYLRRKEGL